MNSSKFFWGIVIIIFGLLFLADNMGLVPASFWSNLWQYWPIALIILGAGFMVGREKRSGWFLLSLVMIIFFIIGSAVWYLKDNNNSALIKTEISEIINNDVNKGEIEVRLGASNLNISSSSSSYLVEGTIDSFGTPTVSRDTKNGIERVVINQLSEGPRLWGGKKNENQIDLKLTEKISLSIIIKTGASKLDLDFSNTKLDNLEIDSGASSSQIKIGGESREVDVHIKSGASSFNISLPEDAGLKITNNSGLSSNNFEKIGLKKDGKIYMSEKYDQTAQKITMILDTGVSSINIELY